jgi:hypothetical protein
MKNIPISDLSARSDQQIRNLIDNHERQNATGRPIYAAALAERERRRSHGLDFETSMRVIRAAAQEGRFLSYKELADASGADWSKVHYAIGGHLWALITYAHARGWPMLSSVVVNKPNVETGEMEPRTLEGFVNAARLLGYAVVDPGEFLREQQALVFAWARADQQGRAPTGMSVDPE